MNEKRQAPQRSALASAGITQGGNLTKLTAPDTQDWLAIVTKE